MRGDDIARIARECGYMHGGRDFDVIHYAPLVNAAIAEDREATALLVEKMGIEGYGTLAIAAAIRTQA